MKISILAATALLLAGTSMAQAAWDQNQTVLDLQAQGFTHIEITVGVTQAKVEASNGTTKVETVYDLATGDIVKTETDPVDPNEPTTPGIEIKTTDEEVFVGEDDGEDEQGDDKGGVSGRDGSDDDEADDHGSDHEHEDESSDDDNSGSGGDDDSGDDHGGDSGHDGGESHDGGDDD